MQLFTMRALVAVSLCAGSFTTLFAREARAETPAARVLPTLAADLPEPLEQPLVVKGPVQAGRAPSSTGILANANDQVGKSPDFVLHVPRDNDHVRWRVVGHRGKVYAARAQDWIAKGRRGDLAKAVTAGDWVVWVSGPGQMGPEWTVVIAPTDEKAKLDPTQRFGAPDADTAIVDHELRIYFPFFDSAMFYGGTVNAASAVLAHQLFMAAPKELFVFTQFDVGTEVHAGEPLLLAVTPSGTTVLTQVLTADGLLVTVKPKELTLAPKAIAVAKAPQKLTLKRAKEQSRWLDEEFLALATADEVTAYKAKKAAAAKCYDDQWQKRDPSHNAGGFVVVSHHGGKLTKEENLADRYEREVVAACKLTAFEANRDKLEQQIISRFEKQRAAWPDELAKRIAELFPGT